MRIPTREEQARYGNLNAHDTQRFNVQERTPDMKLQINADMLGAGQAKALGEASRDLKQLGYVGAKWYVQDQDVKGEDQYNKLLQEANEGLYGKEGILMQKGEAGKDAASKAKEFLTSLSDKYSKNLSDAAHNSFMDRTQRFANHTMTRAHVHAAEEDRANTINIREASMASAKDNALRNAANPEAFNDYAAQYMQALTLKEQVLGSPQEKIDMKRKEGLSGLYLDKVQGLIVGGDLKGARAAVNVGGMLEQDKMRALGVIKQEEKRLQAEARESRIIARIDLGQRVQDASASYLSGATYENPPSRDEFIAAYGEKQGDIHYRELESTRALGEDVQDLHTMTPEEQQALLESRKPEEGEGFASRQKSYIALQKAAQHDAEVRAKDPVAYLASYDSAVKSARSAMLNTMTPESVNAYTTTLQASMEARGMDGTFKKQLPLLSEADARNMAAGIASSTEPEKTLANLQQSFGKHWPTLERQLTAGEKLPPDMAIVASGIQGRPARLLLEAAKNKDFTSGAKVALGPDYKVMQEVVGTSLQDALKTFRASGATDLEMRVRDSTEKLAATYMWQDGMSAKDAAKKAAKDVISDRYTFKGSYRIPKDVTDTDRVDIGAQREITRIAEKASTLSLPSVPGLDKKDVAARFGNGLLRNASWATNEDESGLIMFVGGVSVRNADGSLVRRSWDELRTASHTQNLTMTPQAKAFLEDIQE